MNYHKLAFTDAVKQFQEIFGSRDSYDFQEKVREVSGLSANEIKFISHMDHFFMASIGDNGYPYIQHRGGLTGFVKVLDNKTLGMIDFSGNKQYISLGNITSNPNISLIFLSYPHKARLKIYAKTKLLSLDENPQMLEMLQIENYNYRAERLMLFEIQAFDWNCPQHITPRYTAEEITPIFEKSSDYINELEAEIAALKKKNADKNR